MTCPKCGDDMGDYAVNEEHVYICFKCQVVAFA